MFCSGGAPVAEAEKGASARDAAGGAAEAAGRHRSSAPCRYISEKFSILQQEYHDACRSMAVHGLLAARPKLGQLFINASRYSSRALRMLL
jgi:hypothetical protein